MSNATKEKTAKVSSVPSLRKLTKKFLKHINKCEDCKKADKDRQNKVTNILLCKKGRYKGIYLCENAEVMIYPTAQEGEIFQQLT